MIMNHLRPNKSASGPNDSAPSAAPKKTGRADLSELRHRQVDHGGDRGGGVADRLGVEAVERRHQHAQDQNADLKAGDRMAVDEIDDVDFTGGHGVRSRFFSVFADDRAWRNASVMLP